MNNFLTLLDPCLLTDPDVAGFAVVNAAVVVVAAPSYGYDGNVILEDTIDGAHSILPQQPFDEFDDGGDDDYDNIPDADPIVQKPRRDDFVGEDALLEWNGLRCYLETIEVPF